MTRRGSVRRINRCRGFKDRHTGQTRFELQAFAGDPKAVPAPGSDRDHRKARHKRWLGRGTVRSFSAGHSFALVDSPLDLLPELGAQHSERDRQFLLTQVIHAGLNNLPKSMSDGAAKSLPDWVSAVRTQAAASGYGNSFEALRAHVPWRAWRWDKTFFDRYIHDSQAGFIDMGMDEYQRNGIGFVKFRTVFKGAD